MLDTGICRCSPKSTESHRNDLFCIDIGIKIQKSERVSPFGVDILRFQQTKRANTPWVSVAFVVNDSQT